MMQSAIVRRPAMAPAGLPPVMDRDLRAINRVLAAAGLKARAGLRDGRAAPDLIRILGSVESGQMAIYMLNRPDPGEKIGRISGLIDEISEEITRARRRATMPRIRLMPAAIEVPHWSPAPLRWSVPGDLAPGVARVGRAFGPGGAHDLTMDLDALPHWLIVALSGAGKSVLMAGAMISMAQNTSPDALRIHVVDPKNEDMRDLMRLPHVRSVAIRPDEITKTVRLFIDTLNKRIDDGRADWPREVLLFDELTSAVEVCPAVADLLPLLGNMGRSKRLNIIAGSQSANKEDVGRISKLFSVRLVGTVGSADQSRWASGRKGVGAERLPLRQGAFLAVTDQAETRFTSYYLRDVAGAVASVRAKWGQVSPASSISAPGPAVAAVVDDPASVPVPVDYVDRALRLGWEELHGQIAGAIAEEHAAGVGHNELIRVAYRAGLLKQDYPGGANSGKVRAAISVLEGVVNDG